MFTVGFDASAHMTEETHNAAMSGSIGIVMSIGVSAILGWFLILGLLFSIQDYDTTVASPTGQPVTQIFLDTVGQNGAIVLMVRFSRFAQSNRNDVSIFFACRSSSSARCSSAGNEKNSHFLYCFFKLFS